MTRRTRTFSDVSDKQAIEKIKQMIVSGELSPGDRLPREADLVIMRRPIAGG